MCGGGISGIAAASPSRSAADLGWFAAGKVKGFNRNVQRKRHSSCSFPPGFHGGDGINGLTANAAAHSP